jgi:hypothetical protein
MKWIKADAFLGEARVPVNKALRLPHFFAHAPCKIAEVFVSLRVDYEHGFATGNGLTDEKVELPRLSASCRADQERVKVEEFLKSDN